MSEKVEVTIRVPKKLLDVLEAENYLGWNREEFFEVAVKSAIGITTNAMEFDEEQKFYEKHGKDIATYLMNSTRAVDF